MSLKIVKIAFWKISMDFVNFRAEHLQNVETFEFVDLQSQLQFTAVNKLQFLLRKTFNF